MKKLYLFSFLLFFMLIGNAQVNLPTINLQPLYYSLQNNSPKDINNKTVSCIDTVRYPQTKTTSLLYDTMDYVTYIGAVSQTYYFSGTGLVHGISAYMLLDLDGIAGNTAPVSMVISVRNIDGGNVPTSIIASDTVLLYDVAYAEQPLMFTSPITVSDSFAVVIEIDTLNPSNPYYITNNYGDGLTEALSSLTYTGIWYNLYPTWSGTWDVDMILSPIFEQDFTSSYTVDTNSICLGNQVTFTNTTPTNPNTMFYTTLNSYSLDLGDLTTVPLDTNYTHTYLASGNYSIDLTATQYGYSSNCVDNNITSVTVLDTSVANFGWVHMGGGIFQFSDSSNFSNTYSWDFGDGIGTSSLPNPSYTYSSPGTYQVCFTVSDTNGCNSNTICDSIDFTVGINDFKTKSNVTIYPIPATNYFNVTVPAIYFGGEVVITDVVGKKLKSIAIENQEKVKILTTDIAEGVYFVSIDYKGERIFTKRIVIDK